MATGNPLLRRGLLFVLSSPSGAGKSTIARMILEADDGIGLSVSATTRPIRPGERVRLLVLGVVGAAVFMRLGEPIWYHQDWGHAIYLFVADSVAMIVAGLVILKLLPRQGVAAQPTTTAP